MIMKTKNETIKKVTNLLIVDESGSMSVIQREALAGMNETIVTCQLMQKAHPDIEQRLTLLTFDSQHFKLHYDNTDVRKAHPLTRREYNPCAATPLYDAIGKGIAKVHAQTGKEEKVLVTIITDGEENCSEEYNLAMVKTLIEKLKKQGWTFSLIGTDNLDVESMANAMAIDNHLAFAEEEEATKRMFERERKSRVRFCECYARGCELPQGSYFDVKK